jgi:HAD superfamily hydrolase (TIGR01549 family)
MSLRFSCGIDWTRLDGVIFDIDGTLFDHLALRRPMMVQLLASVLTLRLPPRDLRALQLFRRERDRLAFQEADHIGRRQYEVVAQKLGRSAAEIEAIADHWMCRRPLAFVSRYAFPGTSDLMQALRRRGLRLGVFSDYPADAKLRALGLEVEVACDAAQPEIGRLKPHPEGFLHVARALGVEPPRCLVIGDRDDRDGAAALRGGFPFLKKVGPNAPGASGAFRHYAELVAELEAARPATLSTAAEQARP